MLQNMRDGAQKWIVWIIILLIIISMTLWGISSYFGMGGDNSPAAARVNNFKITQAQLSTSMNRLRLQQPQLFTTPDVTLKLKQEILNQLINQQLLTQAAERQGFAVSAAELDAVVAQIPAFQSNQQFSQTQFAMVLNRLMYTPEQFMADLRSMMLINQVHNGIAATSFSLVNETTNFISYLKQQRDIGYLVIPAVRFKTQIKPTDAQINSYYQQHQDNFMTPEQVSISYLEITPQMLDAQINPTPAELQTYYQTNISNYVTPASWQVAQIVLNVPANATAAQIADLNKKLLDIKQQATKGVSFAVLAKKYSDDVLSAENGGELPWFTAGSLDPTFEKTVVGLKVGEISAPVQTQYGIEIIKLLASKPQTTKAFAEVKSQIAQAYKSQQLQNLIGAKNETLANATFENPSTLQPAAQQLGLTIQTTPLFTRAGEKTGIAANPNVVGVAFSDNVLQQGNNSDVLTLKDGSLLVIRVNKHIVAALKPLDAVRPFIEQQLIQQGAEQQAMQLGQKLLTQLQAPNVSAATLATSNKLVWTTRTNVAREAAGINPEILQQAFNVSPPATNQKWSVTGVELSNGDYAIVGVSKVVNAASKAIAEKQLNTYQKQITDLFSQATYGAYVQAQKDQSKIKMFD
jgi:peptidyl-prolyl cis-trans isomerase D